LVRSLVERIAASLESGLESQQWLKERTDKAGSRSGLDKAGSRRGLDFVAHSVAALAGRARLGSGRSKAQETNYSA